jgi:hypothetical protein
VLLDKAAVLNYARIRNSDGFWVGCECVFTIVYEVLVACTSIYRGDAKNERMLIRHQISFHALTDIQGELQKLQPSAVFLLLLHEIHDTTCWNIFPPSSELRLKHHFWNLVQP